MNIPFLPYTYPHLYHRDEWHIHLCLEAAGMGTLDIRHLIQHTVLAGPHFRGVLLDELVRRQRMENDDNRFLYPTLEYLDRAEGK